MITDRANSGSQRRRRRRNWVRPIALAVAASLLPSVASAASLSGADAATLGRQPLTTPDALGDGAVDGLQYPDPTEGLAVVQPPDASNTGSAQLTYPVQIPPGRGITPSVDLSYDSSAGNGWLGLGWDLSVGEISVDTDFGAPHFDPNYESESYRLNGDLLVPNALSDTWQKRLPGDREDYTRQVENNGDRIIRHDAGTGKPGDYYWEVRDKQGDVFWYGGYPDQGGPQGELQDDGHGGKLTIDRSAIVYDDHGNAVRWLLSAQRDVGVNVILYHYKTLNYTRQGTNWVRAATCLSSGSTLCGRHTYLDSIDYTAAAAASGQPADPPYHIEFKLEPWTTLPSGQTVSPRLDPIVDAKSGYVDVLDERLSQVIDLWRPQTDPTTGQLIDTDPAHIAAAYTLGYSPGRYGKSLLTSVTQVDTRVATNSAVHTFKYFDDVATAGTGLAAPKTWSTGEDLPDKLLLDQSVSIGALGASESNSAEGHAYIGFNPLDPEKVGSFGGSIQVGGGRTNALEEWVDLNGDGLPDKVFLDGGAVKFRLNQGGATDTSSTFSDKGTASNLSSLTGENTINFQFSLEAYPVVTVAFGLGAGVSWGDSYFADVNADGLPDYVGGGQVLFNHLDAAGVPTFTTNSGDTQVPLAPGPAPTLNVSQLDDVQKQLAAQSPLVDTVRRWTAPFSGKVSIDALVTLVADGSKDGVRVAIQRNGTEIAAGNLLTKSSQAFITPITVPVTRGDRIYFRVGSVSDGANDEVTWSPKVTYTAIDFTCDDATSTKCTDGSVVPFDENGLSQTINSSADDFTLSGRPGTNVAMPYKGTVRFATTVKLSKPVTDDVTLVLLHNGNAVPGSAVTIKAGDTCAINGTTCVTGTDSSSSPVSVDFDVAAPVQPDAQHPQVQPSADTVQTYLAVGSPIDLRSVSWTPTLRYTAAFDRLGQPKAVVDPNGQPTIQVTFPPEIQQYPNNSAGGISTPWKSTTSGSFNACASFSTAPKSPGGTVNVRVKSASGLVARGTGTLTAATLPSTQTVSMTLDHSISKNTPYWIDVTIVDPNLSDTATLTGFAFRSDCSLSSAGDAVAPATLYWAGRQGIFPLAYRGWAAAGYTANGSLATSAIDESAFVIDTSSQPTDPPTGFGEVKSDPPKPARSFAFLPVVSPTPIPNQPPPLAGPLWRGPRDSIAINATNVRSSRYGSDSIDIGASAGSGRAVTRVGVNGPSAALAFGLGPLGASFGISPTFGLVDYLDMNGDGFPDVVTPGTVQYTTQRGAFLPDPKSIGDVSVVNQDLTMSVTGGITEGLVDIKGNAKGKTNATQGSAAGKGGDANDSGGGVGIGVEVNASWTSPNASGPADTPVFNDSTTDPGSKYKDQAGQAPGDSSGAGAPIQQQLVDVNGDGLPDRVYTTPSGVFARYNLGYGFAQAPVALATGGFESQESYSGAVSFGFSTPWADFSGGVALNWGVDLSRYTWRDVNGDGIPDQIHKINNTDPPTVAFGTGSGTLAPVVYGQMESAKATDQIDTGQQAALDKSNGLGGGFDFTIYVGPLCIVACYLVINPGASYQNTVTSQIVDLQDVNGDGFADSVSTTDDGALNVRLNTEGRTNLLSTVTNPLGGTIGIDYKRDGNTTAHPGSLFSMSKVTVDDGRPGDGVNVQTTTYDYAGLKYDRLHRTDLGYSSVTAHELDEHGVDVRDTVQTFLNDNVFADGLLTSETVVDPQTGKPLQTSTTHWGFRDVRDVPADYDVNAPVAPIDESLLPDTHLPPSLGLSVAPLATSQGEKWFDSTGAVGQETRTDFVYDGLGNVLVQDDLGQLDDPNDDALATFRYSTCDISAEIFTCAGTTNGPPVPTRPSPLYSPISCPTWVSLPVTFTVTNGKTGAGRVVYRQRDGRRRICDNASVTRLEETVDGSTVAVTELNYDAFGNYNRIVYPAGADGIRYGVAYVYDDVNHGNVADVAEYDFDDASAAHFLDDANTTLDATGAVRVGLHNTATFDPRSGRVATRTDGNNNVTHYTYDAFGRITSISSPRASDPQPLISYEYHPTAAPYAYAIAHHYDAFHPNDAIDTVSFVDGDGRVTQTKRDARLYVGPGQPAVDTRIVSGAQSYDALGRVVEGRYPTADNTAQTTFDASPTKTAATTTAFDLLDRQTEQDLPGARTTKTSYGFGKASATGPVLFKTTATDPKLRATITYTDVREVTQAVDDQPAGLAPSRMTYTSDGMGQLVDVVDPGGNHTTNVYDLLGRTTLTTTPDGGEVDYVYDAEGKLVSKSTPNERASAKPADRQTTYTYQLDKLVSVDNPTGTADVTYTYGGAGAPGNGAGRVTQIDDGSRIEGLAYDEAGNVVTQTAQMKVHQWYSPGVDRSKLTWTTSWSYDGLGRLENMTYPDGEKLTYGYDSGGLVSSIVGDAPGFITLGASAGADGNGLTDVVEKPTIWHYDYLVDRQYDVFLRTNFDSLGNGVNTTTSFDPDTQWMTRRVTISPNRAVKDPAYQKIQDLNYTYDAVGNPKTVTNDLPPPVANLYGGASTQTYNYDGYDRLKDATGSWTASDKKVDKYTFKLGYDINGNVTSKDQTDTLFMGTKGIVQKKTTYSYSRTYKSAGPHQVSTEGDSSYRYDLDGNFTGVVDSKGHLIRSQTYDATDALTQVSDHGSSTTYTYDDSGQRTIERGPGGETAFINPWVTERNTTELYKQIWAGDDRIATQRNPSGQPGPEELQRYFLHKDLQGSTNMVTDYRGNTFQHHEYFPTGEVWVDEHSTVFRTPYQFDGTYIDEVRGIDLVGSRWYDPVREMMYSPDPELTDDPSSLVDQPDLRYAYTYAGANPLANSDPTGLVIQRVQPRVFTAGSKGAVLAETKAGRDRLRASPYLRGQVAARLKTRLPKALVNLGLDIKKASERQEKINKFKAAPLVEINISDGTVKFAAGIEAFQTEAISFRKKATAAGTTAPAGPTAPANPPAAGGGAVSAAAAGSATPAAAGGGAGKAPPPLPPKPPKPTPSATQSGTATNATGT